VLVLIGALGASVRLLNDTRYTAAIAASVLIAIDLPHPSTFGAEGERVLYTFLGVGIAALVMFLVDRLQKHASKTAPPAADPTGAST
jgi:uncharacterized membrane protein YgaE (UPF0421/DUF939 family)